MSYVTNDEIPEDDCSICLETLKDPLKAVFKLVCGHFFHNNCLEDYCNLKYPNTTCPLCRTQFDDNKCNFFYAFKHKALYMPEKYLPREVLDIYNLQHGGKRKQKRNNKSTKKNKSKKQNKSNKKIRKTKKQKIRYMK